MSLQPKVTEGLRASLGVNAARDKDYAGCTYSRKKSETDTQQQTDSETAVASNALSHLPCVSCCQQQKMQLLLLLLQQTQLLQLLLLQQHIQLLLLLLLWWSGETGLDGFCLDILFSKCWLRLLQLVAVCLGACLCAAAAVSACQ